MRFAISLCAGLVCGSAWPRYLCGDHGQRLEVACAANGRGSVAVGKQRQHTFTPDAFKPYTLLSSRYESHDTRRFYFALDSADEAFVMPVASCVLAKYIDAEGTEVVRPYTPISPNNTKGHFELIVKKYPRSRMGNHLFTMQPGEQLLIKGPFDKLAYRANMWKHVGMIAGGTGIAPMYQLIRAIVDNRTDKTRISLIYANNERDDILLASELTQLQKTHDNFHMYLTLLKVPPRWLGGVGYVNAAMLSTFMPPPSERQAKILVCGPPAMMDAVCGDKQYESGKPPQQGPLRGLLHDLGYSEEQVYKF